jgi:hypothetical protein
MAVLCGHPVISAFCFMIQLAYLLQMARRSAKERFWAALTLASGIFVLSAVQVIPFLADMPVHANYKTHWDGGPFHQWWLFADPKSEIYVPLPFWGLASVGLMGSARKTKLFFGIVFLYGLLVMFPILCGSMIRWIMTLGGNMVGRYGEEAFWIGLLGMCSLGVEEISTSWSRKDRWPVVRSFVYGSAGFYILAWFVMSHHFTFFWPAIYRKLNYLELLTCLPALATPMLPRKTVWGAIAGGGCLSLAMLPSCLPSTITRLCASQDYSVFPPKVVKVLQREGIVGPQYRIYGEFQDRIVSTSALCANQALYWGLADIRLTSPIALRTFVEFSDHWQVKGLNWVGRYFPRPDKNLLQFLGVRSTIENSSPDAGADSPLSVHFAVGSEPWVRGIGEWEVEPSETEAFHRTFELIDNGNWRRIAVVDRPPGLRMPLSPPWHPPRISWDKTGPNLWTWRIESSSPGLLLILQNDHPGWLATIDGKPQQILKAYGTFMAIPYAAGDHLIRLRFRALWFFAALIISAVGWLAALLWMIADAVTKEAPRAGGCLYSKFMHVLGSCKARKCRPLPSKENCIVWPSRCTPS